MSRIFASVFLSVLLVCGSAHAADPDAQQARKYYEKGTQYYDLGRYDEAARQFEAAYEIKQDAALLYNIAQAYRRMGDNKRALELYKNFLRRMPDSSRRTEVEGRIGVLQKLVDESASKPASVTPAPAVEPPAPAKEEMSAPAPVPVAAPPTTANVVAAPAPVLQPAPSKGLRTAGIVMASVGAVGVAAGVIFGLRARSLSNQVEKATQFNTDDDAAGKRAETLEWVCYSVGAAALVTGVVLTIVGWPNQADGARAYVSPTILSNGGGLVAGGSF
jgi:tetratricopeptide (TPR) repeat protein